MDEILQHTKRVEAWLSKTPDSLKAWVVDETERRREVHLDSLSLMGAQRELSGWLVENGFEPLQRWSYQDPPGGPRQDFQECVRHFRLKT
jgi:hypothetical protein